VEVRSPWKNRLSANPPPAPAQEFRPYRRLVSGFVLIFIFAGSGYLLVSVGVSIYRQRHAVPTGATVGARLSPAELRGCWQELSDVAESLEKHVEKSHYLLGGYDPEEAQRWADEGAFWRNQWKVLGQRCRLSAAHAAGGPKELEQMLGAYRDLHETEAAYTKELMRFGREQIPRLDRVRERIDRIGKRLESLGAEPATSGDHKP
jgi:hypothetical protein